MSNSSNHPSQPDHGIHGTTLAPISAVLDIDTVDVTLSLSLNSTTTLSSQNQAIPLLDQLSPHHQLDAARARRSNLNIPFGLHAHSSSNSYHMQPRNNVNLNFCMGNSSAFNINLLDNSPVSQFARNSPFAGSSGTPPTINIYNSAPSHVQQPISNVDPYQGAMLDRWITETNNSPRFTRHPRYASPVVATGSGNTRGTYATNYEQQIPTAIPYPRQNIASQSTHQGQQSNLYQRVYDRSRSIFQRRMGLSLSNQPFEYPGERYNHVPSLPWSIQNSPNHQVPILVDGNGTLYANSFRPQPNPTFPESQPASEVAEAAEQAPEPNNNEVTQPTPQAGRHHQSSLSGRSHPYRRYGQYTCPKCHVVFDNANSYAAHAQVHYKDETPDERMKRRERKIKKRDMHIANTADGITVMPGSLQQGEQSIRRNVNAPVIIKEEV